MRRPCSGNMWVGGLVGLDQIDLLLYLAPVADNNGGMHFTRECSALSGALWIIILGGALCRRP